MTAGHVNRTTLSSNYQSVGDVYSDTKTEGAFEVIAQQVDDNYDAAVAINSSLTTHKTATTLDHPDGSVKTPKIADLAVTQAKIANGAVGPNQLQTGLAATVDVNAQFAKRGIDVTSSPYFAKGDGVTDDTAAIQAAIDAASAAGGGIVWLPLGRYMITGTNVLTLYSNVSLKGVKGASILDFSSRSSVIYKYFVNAFGSVASGVALTADVGNNQNVIELNTTGFSAGDLIIITSNYEWLEVGEPTNSAKQGEYAIIDEVISSSKLRLKSATNESYAVADTARVHKVTPVKNIIIDGIEFRGRGRINGGEGDSDMGVGITYGQNIVVRNCNFIDIDCTQLEFRSCYDVLAENNYHFHSKYFSSSGGVGEAKPVALASRGTVQYQARASDCSMYVTIRNCVGEGGRHFFNTGHSYRYMDGSSAQQVGQLFGINRHIRVENCYSKNTWHAGFSTHGDAEYVDFINCTSENSGQVGFNPRAKHIRVVGCTITNAKAGIQFTDFPRNCEVLNNRIVNCAGGIIMSGMTNLDVSNIRVDDNYLENVSVEIITINATASTSLTGELNINNNTILNSSPTGNNAPIRVIGAFDANIQGNRINKTSGTGYQIRLEKVVRAIVEGNIVKAGYRLMTALSDCTRVVVANNTFVTHTFGTIDNSSTSPTNQNNVIL